MTRLVRLWRWLDKRLSAKYRHVPILDREAVRQHPTITVHEYDTLETVTYPALSVADVPHEIARNYGEHQFPRPFLLELANAQIQGRHATVLTHDGAIVLESQMNHAPYIEQASLSRVHYPRNLSLLRQQLQSVHYPLIAPLVNLYSDGYFHWILEGLPRLQVLAEHQAAIGQSIQLLIDPNPPQWMTDSLRLLGFTNWIEWQHTHATVDKLLLAWHPGWTGMPSPQACRWLTQQLQAQLPAPTVSMPHIYITRRRANVRRVLNEDAVIAIVTSYGFEVVELETLSFAEQVQLFRQARVVIGAHGAGFANLIHSTQATMLEFFEPSYLNACFYRLASGLGHEYHFMLGTGEQGNIQVDIAELKHWLKAFADSM